MDTLYTNPSVSSAIATDFVQRLLEPGTERDRAFTIHPVVTDKAKIPTPAIKEAFEVIKAAIVHYDPGVCFSADARFGKTYGIEVLRQTLPQSFPGLPTFWVAAKGHDRPSERSLYSDLLLDCHHGITDSGTAMARRLRLLNMWIATAQASNSDRLLLFVDEAQNWNEDEFTHLRDLSNDLASREVRLIVLLFAHPSLLVIRTSLLGQKRTDLIGRFMLHPVAFRGVTSLIDLQEVAKCYDDPTISEFPAGTGISYSQFFRPNSYRNGWRLEKEAKYCWAAFSRVATKHGGNYQIGMQWVTGAIREVLYSYWRTEHGELADEGDLWERAIDASGFESALGVIQDQKPAV